MNSVENTPSKGALVFYAVIWKSLGIPLVLLYAAAITSWELFENPIVRRLFGFSCLVFALTFLVYITIRPIESQPDEDN